VVKLEKEGVKQEKTLPEENFEIGVYSCYQEFFYAFSVSL